MQSQTTCWTDLLYEPSLTQAPPIGEPMRSLLRHRLEDLERRLLDLTQSMDQLMRESAGPATTALFRSRTEQAALTEVRAALARFDNDTYGLCASCGLPIEPERLVTRPQTTHCRYCEQHS